ncbi:MAG: hypothetical protein ACQKBW_09065, partial [Puniceicoccales bacterium]
MSTPNKPTGKQTVHVVPFSHLDLFWTGTREQCLSRGNFIISQALEILEKHPDFRYLIETVNFLDQYLDCYPEELDRIRKLAQGGQLELSPIWTGIYQNLPGGETLARNVLYAKRYMRDKMGCDPKTAHFGDLPGYTPQYPQIAKLGGIRNVLMSRGGPASMPLFHWEALNGDRLLSYFVKQGYAAYAMHTHWHKTYEDMAGGKIFDMLEFKLADTTHPSLIHWGSDLYAPHENMVHNVRTWNEKQDLKLRFSTFEEYFTEVADAEGVPVLKGEIPAAWPNVESSWPDVWPEDMPCEAALHMAEFLSVTCLAKGWTDYPQRELEDAWKALLDGMDHNQNAQGGDRADRDKLQIKKYARYAAERIIDKMSWRLASRVPVPAANAFPVVAFNSMSWSRDGIVSGPAAIYGPVRSCDIGEFDQGLKLIDEHGQTIPYVPLV